ncbi:hypothetical protein LSPH24S_09426 [Lysinibacillus sphaericus]
METMLSRCQKRANSSNPKKYISLVVTLTVVFAIAIILFANVYIIEESEYAIVTTIWGSSKI